MRRAGGRTARRAGVGVAALAATLAIVLLGPSATTTDAGAYRLGGIPFRGPTITVATPRRFRAPVADAVAAWNRSGARIRLRVVPGGRADIDVRVMPGTLRGLPCGASRGVSGLGTVGDAFPAIIYLDANCNRWELVGIAAHEIGHTLGLGHDNRSCALMNTMPVRRCGPNGPFSLLPWEYLCRPLYADDVAGVIRRYGGRMRAIATTHACAYLPLPAAPRDVRVDVNVPGPGGGASRISWTNPTGPAPRQVVVMRRRSGCDTHPVLRGPVALRYDPSGRRPRSGDVVDIVAPVRGRQSVVDVDVPPGPWCYSVWTIGPANRWRNSAARTIMHPGGFVPGLAVSPPGPADGSRTLTWRTGIGYSRATLTRAVGTCPIADPGAAERLEVDVATRPETVRVTDTVPPFGQSLCYRLVVDAPGADGTTRTAVEEVQVGP